MTRSAPLSFSRRQLGPSALSLIRGPPLLVATFKPPDHAVNGWKAVEILKRPYVRIGIK